ncbi:hypothetical protein RIR_jg29098.t1 [Rhizophagus irregularis DAOM 181602=DAOM 197198]|nr:hypothetical protein RIR_jg29098.t1 [Rhizophagus irregularis DAOM 181602=DAOM 197198]
MRLSLFQLFLYKLRQLNTVYLADSILNLETQRLSVELCCSDHVKFILLKFGGNRPISMRFPVFVEMLYKLDKFHRVHQGFHSGNHTSGCLLLRIIGDKTGMLLS